jgi:hypothetical protein
MFTRSQESTPKPRSHKEGQRLYCHSCGSEIEIIIPCTGASRGQVLQCCGRDMTVEVGHAVHLESES